MKKHTIKGGSADTSKGTIQNRNLKTPASDSGGKAAESYGALKGAGTGIAGNKGTANSRHSVTKPGGDSPIGHAQPLRKAKAVSEPRGTDQPLGKNTHKWSKPQK